MKFTLVNFFYLLFSVAIVITLLIIGKNIFAPLVFAVLFALALSPVCDKLDQWGINSILSIMITFTGILIIISGVILLFSVTFANIYEELPQIQDKIDHGLSLVENEAKDLTGLSEYDLETKIQENKSKVLSPLWKFVEESVSASLLTIGNILLCVLYTFLLLSYRKGIKKILFENLNEKQKKDRNELINSIHEVIQGYTLSIVLVMVLLGVINGTGLWIIGIDYPFFWGFLAGVLVIIPYVGTTLGAILPVLYALATTDTVWQPVAIIIMYMAVQQIEGNLITPKIVGTNVNVNALTVILAMIAGGLIWGLSGLILAMPTVALARAIFIRYENTNRIGQLMSAKLHKK